MKRTLINKTLLACCIATLTLSTTDAQNLTNDTILLDQVVVTGSKKYRSAGNVTQKIDVISSKTIERAVAGNNNLAEILSEKPGLSVAALSRNDANWGTYAGIGPKYSTYMLNGLPLDAFIDPMSLNLNAIERIEVQRGPASVLYPNYLSQDFAGNQSPLAGTVNLILKENINHRESAFQTSYGSFNTLNTQAYHQNVKEDLNYFGGITFENSDYTNYGTEGSWLNMQKDPEYQNLRAFAGANFYYGTRKNNHLSAFINKTTHQGDAGRIYRGFKHDYTTVNLKQSTEISENLNFHLSAGLRIYDRTWQESNFNVVDSLVSNNGVNQKIIPVDANLTWKHGNNNLLTIGADYQNAQYYTTSDPLAGYLQYGNKSRAYQSGVYAQEEIVAGNLTARAGLRLNYIKTTIDLISGGNAGEPETDYTNLLWSAGLKYRFSPFTTLFANAGSSFLPPGLKSMGGTIKLSDRGVANINGQLPNPDLRPESGMAVDFGTNIALPARIVVSARGFIMMVDDAIIDIRVSESPSQSQSINAGKTNSSGFEIEASQQLSSSLSWFANYTYMNSTVENENDAEQDGGTVPFAPEHVANAGISVETDFGLIVRPVLNYNGGYYDSSVKSARKKFTPGALINVYASQRMAEKESFSLNLFATVYNLTNNKYEMPWQFQNTGLAVNGGIRIQFK